MLSGWWEGSCEVALSLSTPTGIARSFFANRLTHWGDLALEYGESAKLNLVKDDTRSIPKLLVGQVNLGVVSLERSI